MPHLTPTQLGRLAFHVQLALNTFPLDRQSDPEPCPFSVDQDTHNTMNLWEKELKRSVNDDPIFKEFGGYDALDTDFDNSDMLDALISYYNPS